MKLFKGAVVLISIAAGLAWADGTLLCTCTQPSVKTSLGHFTGDIRLDSLLQGISPEKYAAGTLL